MPPHIYCVSVLFPPYFTMLRFLSDKMESVQDDTTDKWIVQYNNELNTFTWLKYTIVNRLRVDVLASFPGRSHLQYLIAYSMQIRRGKAWEISHVRLRQVDRR